MSYPVRAVGKYDKTSDDLTTVNAVYTLHTSFWRTAVHNGFWYKNIRNKKFRLKMFFNNEDQSVQFSVVMVLLQNGKRNLSVWSAAWMGHEGHIWPAG